jgi:DNA invertase Pin-like site-specific DNA recombinase
MPPTSNACAGNTCDCQECIVRGMRTAIYTRISLDKDGQQLGVQRQEQECRNLADRQGLEVVTVYSDNDLSAYNGKTRPGFEKMLTALADREFDAILCWHPDRLYRSLKDLERLIDIADTTEIRTVNGGDIDLGNSTGKMLARILGSVSRQESEHKGERQRLAAVQKAKRGEPKWKNAFGYTTDGTRQLDPKTAPLVKQAYKSVNAGASLNDVCRMFNQAGAFGLNGRKWTSSTVSLFLRKPRNAGLRTYNGVIVKDVKGTWPALVDETLFASVQAHMNAPHRKPGRKSVPRHLLTSMMLCGKCPDDDERSRLSGHVNIHGQTVYVCKRCRGIAIRAEHVEPLLYAIVCDRLARPDAVDLLKAEIQDQAEAEAIRGQLNILYSRLESIGVDIGEGLISGVTAKAAVDTVKENIAKLERRQQDATRLRVFADLPLGKSDVAEKIRRLSPDRFRAVLTVLMTITVTPVGKGSHTFKRDRVQVRWN